MKQCMHCGELIGDNVMDKCPICFKPIAGNGVVNNANNYTPIKPYIPNEPKVVIENKPANNINNANNFIPANTKEENEFNGMSIFSIILGIVIIIMGIVVMNKDVYVSTHRAKTYSVDSARFGADFYTEMYNASDVMVDELNDINGGISDMSRSIDEVAEIVCFSVGMLIVALGIGVIAVSCNFIKK